MIPWGAPEPELGYCSVTYPLWGLGPVTFPLWPSFYVKRKY